MPQGTPGRKSFVAFPRNQKYFWRPEAVSLRKMFPVAATLHGLFILIDIFVYGEILILIADVVLLWLDFYNFMLLNKICIIIEVVLQALISLIAVTHIQRGLQSGQTSKTTVVLFIVQMFVSYPLLAFLIGKRFYAHWMQQFEWKMEQKNKTVKGKIELKMLEISKK